MARQGHLRALSACITTAAAVALLVPVAADASYASRTLKLRSQGRDVKVLQTYLTKAGYNATVDGYYGRQTRAAERRFEAAQNRSAAGRATRPAHLPAQKLARAARPAPAQASAPPESATLSADGRTATAPADAPQPVKDAIAAANS